jgi:hypothetical protein
MQSTESQPTFYSRIPSPKKRSNFYKLYNIYFLRGITLHLPGETEENHKQKLCVSTDGLQANIFNWDLPNTKQSYGHSTVVFGESTCINHNHIRIKLVNSPHKC